MCHIYRCGRPNKTGTKLPNFSVQSFTHLSIDSLVMKGVSLRSPNVSLPDSGISLLPCLCLYNADYEWDFTYQ